MKFIQILSIIVTLILFQVNYVACDHNGTNVTTVIIITTTKVSSSTLTSTSFNTEGILSSTTPIFPDLSDNNKNTTVIVVLSLFAIVGIAAVSIFLACQYFKSKKTSERYNTLNMDSLNSSQARSSGESSVQMRSRGDDFQIEFTNPAFHFEQDEIQGPPNHNRISRARADSFDD